MTTLSLAGSVTGNPRPTDSGGFMVGSATAPFLFRSTNNTGSRLSDLKVQSSAYGNSIPVVLGSYRVSGNVIWSTNMFDVSDGAAGATAYIVSCAIAVCAGPVAGITRVWADNKLVYSSLPEASGSGIALTTSSITFYPGNEEQLPDPTIEANKGAGNVPAFRGLCYVVLTDLLLQPFGNRLPNFTFEVGPLVPTPVTLREIVMKLSLMAGLQDNQLDVTALASDVHGFALTRQQPARAALEPLMKAFAFDAVESGATVKFVQRGALPAFVMSIDETVSAE